MSGSNHEDEVELEKAEGKKLSQCLRVLMDQLGISSEELSERTSIPASTVRRQSNPSDHGDEPPLSRLARYERAMGVEIGVVARMAELVKCGDTREMIASDPKLWPMFREIGAEHYDTWVKRSS